MKLSSISILGLAGLGLLLCCAPARATDSAQGGGAAPALSATASAPAAPKHKHKHKVYHAAADAVPDFTLDTVDGKPFHLRDHIGQVVLIDFWATWCGPCRMAIPHLIELQKRYGGRNFTVVGVSLDQQGPAVVAPFAQAWNLNYPVVVDQDGSLSHLYGDIRAIPTTFVIDREGRVVGDPLVGYRPYDDYKELVLKALKS
ncbi:MAG TPA: TlpA disulfide reductase family protein [bacterium]|jgi:thiol-disulfide isomerase/thioredoxin|nr:TlpA disulfide reductase family protein [bacterium]